MAFPKKKSRIITIDGKKYRCMVGPNDGYCVFYAELDDAKGRIIEAYFETEIDNYWVEFPNVSKLNLKILKPKDFESIIRQAQHLGWDPTEKGKPLQFDWVNDRLIER
jgi:hypothetical protein